MLRSLPFSKSQDCGSLLASALLLDLSGLPFLGNLLLLIVILIIFNKFVLDDVIRSFQNRILPAIMRRYEQLLHWSLRGWRPVYLLLGTIVLLIVSFMIFSSAISSNRIGIVFFPQSDPNYVYVYLKFPVGTDVEYTDSVTRVLEKRVYTALGMDNGKRNPLVESIISNIAVGAADPSSGDQSTRPELGRIQVSFIEAKYRGKVSDVTTKMLLDSIRSLLAEFPVQKFL